MQKKTKRILAGIGALVLAGVLYLATPYTPHPVGFHAAYRLGFDGTLHISGTGTFAPQDWFGIHIKNLSCSIARLWPMKYFEEHIKAVEMSGGLTAIGNCAFENCYNLTSVTISDCVTSIGWSAFKDCTNLTNVTIPNRVTSIGDYAFSGCSSLTNVTILDRVPSPDRVTSIGDYAFSGCSSLTNVTIPDRVTSIRESAFGDCTRLSEITFEGDAPKLYDNCFYAVEATVYYPSKYPTWAGIAQQTYGGDITWVAY